MMMWCCTYIYCSVAATSDRTRTDRLSGDRKFITPRAQDLCTRGTAKTKTRTQHPYFQRRRDDVARSLCVFYRTTSVSQTWRRLVPFMPVQPQSYPAHTNTRARCTVHAYTQTHRPDCLPACRVHVLFTSSVAL